MAGHDDDDGDAMWEELSMVAAGKAGPAPEVMARRRRWERFAARMYAVLVIVTMAVDGSCEWVGVVEPPYTAQRRSAGWG